MYDLKTQQEMSAEIRARLEGELDLWLSERIPPGAAKEVGDAAYLSAIFGLSKALVAVLQARYPTLTDQVLAANSTAEFIRKDLARSFK